MIGRGSDKKKIPSEWMIWNLNPNLVRFPIPLPQWVGEPGQIKSCTDGIHLFEFTLNSWSILSDMWPRPSPTNIGPVPFWKRSLVSQLIEKVSYQFSGEMRSPWLPLAKHEISMRNFKAGDVLRRQMLYRLSTDGFQETLSFILFVQCQ